MIAIILALTVGFVGSLELATANSQEASIPDVLLDVDGRVAWISGARLADASSRGDGSESPSWLRERRQRDASGPSAKERAQGDSCFDYSRLEAQANLPVGSTIPIGFGAIIRHAETVFSGTVLSAVAGLAVDTPEILLLVETDTWFKRRADIPASSRVYLRFPAARVNIIGVEVCRPDQVYLPRTPRPGDRLIAAKYGDFLSPIPGPIPLLYAGTSIVFERKSRIWTSDRMFGESPQELRRSTIEALENRVRAIVAAER